MLRAHLVAAALLVAGCSEATPSAPPPPSPATRSSTPPPSDGTPAPPSGSPCFTIDKTTDDHLHEHYRLWLDSSGRPTYLDEGPHDRFVHAWTYDRAGMLATFEWWNVSVAHGVETYTYGAHGELLEMLHRVTTAHDVSTFDDLFTWQGTFHAVATPPAFGRGIPLLAQRGTPTPDVGGNETYEPPAFTGTVSARTRVVGMDDIPHGTWTFDRASPTVVVFTEQMGGVSHAHTRTRERLGDRVVITDDRVYTPEMQTWDGDKLVEQSVKADGLPLVRRTLTYDAKGRWTGTTSDLDRDATYKVTPSCP